MFTISHIAIDPETMLYRLEIDEGAPLMTSHNKEATERILELLPGISQHACFGDDQQLFGDNVSHTELAHLLEHMVVELLSQTKRCGKYVYAKSRQVKDRAWETQVICLDDTLTLAALASALWMLKWSFESGEGEPPNVEATVTGLCALIDSLDASSTAEEDENSLVATEADEAAGDHLDEDSEEHAS